MDNLTRYFILLDMIAVEVEAGENPLNPKIRAISRKANTIFYKVLTEAERQEAFMIIDAEQADADLLEAAR